MLRLPPRRISHIHPIISILLLTICYPKQVVAEWTEWLVDSELSYTFQDNINHSLFSSAEESDHVWNGQFSVGRANQVGNNTRIITNIFLKGAAHHKFEVLNQLNSGAGIAVHHKFGFGRFQPWVRGLVTTEYIFSKSKIREGYITTVGFDIGKAFNERFDIALSYRYDDRTSPHTKQVSTSKLIKADISPDKSSHVFDIQGHSVGLQLNTLVTQQWALAFAYNFRVGDSVSSNLPGLIPKINHIVDAIEIDDAFPGWAYRSNSNTHHYSVDANYVFLKGHASFNIGYDYIESHSDSLSYKNNLLHVNINYSF